MSTQDWRDGYAKGKETGLKLGRQRLIQELTKLGTIRDSMLGDNWKVIYTEHGATDIRLDRLENNE